MREVEIIQVNPETKRNEAFVAYFHQWAQNFEEFEEGPGMFPVAIVERKDDGQVVIVSAGTVRFIEPP